MNPRANPAGLPLTRRALLTAGFVTSLHGAAAAAPKRPPNLVVLLADDLGWGDLSSYGCPDARTPNIDGIGERGVRFLQSYANGPECTPTRTALLTGRYQQRVGGMECAIGIGDTGRYDDAEWLQKRGELGLPVSETTLPAVLKQHGYDTACMGKWHLGYPSQFWPHQHGFDSSFGVLGGAADYFTHREDGEVNVLYEGSGLVERGGYTTDLIAGAAIEWLRRRTQKPFFLYVPFTAPHTPIQDPDAAMDPKTGTAPVRQRDRPTYAKMVERLDARIGDILAQLDKMGAAGNTLVVFASDNGGDPNGRNEPYRDRKSSLWEGGIRVPMMMRWPGTIPERQTTTQVAVTMDLMPTLLAAAGMRVSAARKLDGVNLLPVLEGRRKPFTRTLFWRSKRGTRVRKAVRDGDWKYVIDAGKEELHNLATDEREQHDVLGAEPKRAAALRSKIAAWERDVMAPRLRPFRSIPG